MKSYFYVSLVYLQFCARSSASPISVFIGLPNSETNPVQLSQVKRPYRFSKIFFPGDYPPKPALNGEKLTSECLPNLIPTLKMKNRLRKAINICVKSSVKRTMSIKEELPCQDIREVLQRSNRPTQSPGEEHFKDFQGSAIEFHGDESVDVATNKETISPKEEEDEQTATYDYEYDAAIVGALNIGSEEEESATRLQDEDSSALSLEEAKTDAPEELERRKRRETGNNSAEQQTGNGEPISASDLARTNADLMASSLVKNEESQVAAGGATADGESTLEATVAAVQEEQLDEIVESTDGYFSSEDPTTYYGFSTEEADVTDSPDTTTELLDSKDLSGPDEVAVEETNVVMEAPTMQRLAADANTEEETSNEGHLGIDIVLENLVGVDELNFIADVIGGSFRVSNHKDSEALLLPTMGSQALFTLDSYEKPTSSEVFLGEDKHQMLFGAPRSTDDSNLAVQQFLVYLMSLKLSEFMQSCLAKEMALVDEAGAFQPSLFEEFFLLAFQDTTSDDWTEISFIIKECDAQTKNVKESIRPYAFSVGCFDKKVAEFCSLRRKFTADQSTYQEKPRENKYLPTPGLVDNLNRLPDMQVIGFEHTESSDPFQQPHAELVAVDVNLTTHQTTDFQQPHAELVAVDVNLTAHQTTDFQQPHAELVAVDVNLTTHQTTDFQQPHAELVAVDVNLTTHQTTDFQQPHAELVAVDVNMTTHQTIDWSENNSSTSSGTPITMDILDAIGTTEVEAPEPLLDGMDESTYDSPSLITVETLVSEEISMEATPLA